MRIYVPRKLAEIIIELPPRLGAWSTVGKDTISIDVLAGVNAVQHVYTCCSGQPHICGGKQR